MQQFPGTGRAPNLFYAGVFARYRNVGRQTSGINSRRHLRTQTEATVRIFQTEYDLPATGEVDNDTWDRIIEVYTDVRVYAEPPHATQMFPASDYVIRGGRKRGLYVPDSGHAPSYFKQVFQYSGF